MAHGDTEIEIKIQLKEDVFFRAREKAKRIARFVKASQQADTYYTSSHRNFLEPEFPFEWLSIRKRAGKNILNYKHFHPENARSHTHCDEFEVEADSVEKLEMILSVLGARKLVTVEKEREA